jgi:hypothetical protein
VLATACDLSWHTSCSHAVCCHSTQASQELQQGPDDYPFVCRTIAKVDDQLQPSATRLACRLAAQISSPASFLAMQNIATAHLSTDMCSAVLLECCALHEGNNTFAADMADWMLKQMQGGSVPLAFVACCSLLSLQLGLDESPKFSSIQTTALEQYLMSVRGSTDDDVRTAIAALPADCVQAAARAYASLQDAEGLLALLQAAPTKGWNPGWLQQLVQAFMQGADEAWNGLPYQQVLSIGIAAQDAASVDWLLSEQLRLSGSSSSTEVTGLLTDAVLVLLLRAGYEEAAGRVLQQALRNNFGETAVEQVRWGEVAEAAGRRLGLAKSREVAKRVLKMLQLCWAQGGVVTAAARGRAAVDAAKSGLWGDAVELLGEVGEVPAEVVEHLLAALPRLRDQKAEDASAKAFMVRSYVG